MLNAPEIRSLQAIIRIETLRGRKLADNERYAPSMAMRSETLRGLVLMLVAALDGIEWSDGTRVRREWAGHFVLASRPASSRR